MEIIRQTVKNYVSTWLLTLFACGLLGLLAFSEIFQNVVRDDSKLDSFSNPIKADIIANLKSIKLSNRLGKYTVTQDENGHWNLVEPRKMPAPALTIKRITDSLESISIHTIHQKEPINLQSFSLDNPIAILDLYTKLDEHLQVKIGLVNPINNTSYMTISNHDFILQTTALKSKLELLRLSDFVDSNIFSQDLANIKQFELFRGSSTNSSNRLTKSMSGWDSKKYKVISEESVNNTLRKILAIKSHMIIDSQDEKLLNLLNNYLKNPLYRIRIKTLDGHVANYTVSRLLGSIPDLKIEKRHFFLIKSSERKYPHLINKSYLDKLQIRYSDLK